jgi:uncharacterized protein (TIGR02466 family)
MDRKITPLFSVPLYKTELEITDEENNNFLNVVESLDYYLSTDDMDHLNGFISNNQNILELIQFQKLKNLIETELKVFLYDCLKIDQSQQIRHSCSWITKHEYGHCSHQHTHNNSLFSGVYYIKVPKDSGEFLTLHSPIDHRIVVPTLTEFNMLNSTLWDEEVYEKKLLLFPSSLKHGVSVSKSYEARYCLAFNYFLTGKFGTDTSHAYF